MLNSLHGPEEMEEKLPAKVKRDLAEKEISFYTIDAGKIAQEIGLGSRINMVMQAAFFQADRSHSRGGRDTVSKRRYREDLQ